MGERYARLVVRLGETTEPIGTTIVSVEEQMRGWLSAISKEKKIDRQVRAYHEFQSLFASFQTFVIAPFDASAVTAYRTLRTGRGHLGMRGTKIGAITISRDALLLTANRKDFEQMPGLRFENWMDPPAGDAI
jgi:tRNA(fMet)-specific endonuclease VapC